MLPEPEVCDLAGLGGGSPPLYTRALFLHSVLAAHLSTLYHGQCSFFLLFNPIKEEQRDLQFSSVQSLSHVRLFATP